jgi:myosin heavy subunit
MKPKEDPTMLNKKKSSLELLTMELEKINSTLWNPKGGKGAKSKEAKELEVPDLTKIATSLSNALNSVKMILEEEESRKTLMEDALKRVDALEKKEVVMEEKMRNLDMSEKRVRNLEDNADHHHQRSLKGKFFITSTKTNSAIKSERDLEEEGVSVAKHVEELVEKKLGVKVRKEDIKSCHHTRTGLIVRLWDFKAGSVYDQVVSAIKSGQGRQVKDVFINFALTNRRASLLYEVRQLVRSKSLEKFFVESDGSISVLPVGSGANWAATKVRLTSVRGGVAWGEGGGAGAYNHNLWTATPSEVRARFAKTN